MKTPYDVLGVPRNASDVRIRTAFRNAAKAYHPDLNAGDPTAEQQIRQVIAAYEILKTPQKRVAYDRYLHECRRERVWRFGMSAVASLLSCIIVALAFLLSVWLSDTRETSAPPTTPHIVTAEASPAASKQTAAAADRGRQEINRGNKSDWNTVPEHGPLHHQQTAGSLPPAASPPELYTVMARAWGLEASGERMSFAHETERARSEPIVLIDAAASSAADSPKKRSLEDHATQFVSSQIADRSSTNTSGPGSLARAYANNVLYYGKRKSRQAILVEKRRELERWPERVYDVQRDSMRVQCLKDVCKVRGIMAWQTRNSHRATMASGISKFDYEISPSGGGFRILSESGSVVKRYQQAEGRNHSRRIKVTAHQQKCERPITSYESRNPVGQSCTMRMKS